MDTDTAFIISGVMCLPFLTFLAYFFDDCKSKEECNGWKGFFKWIARTATGSKVKDDEE